MDQGEGGGRADGISTLDPFILLAKAMAGAGPALYLHFYTFLLFEGTYHMVKPGSTCVAHSAPALTPFPRDFLCPVNGEGNVLLSGLLCSQGWSWTRCWPMRRAGKAFLPHEASLVLRSFLPLPFLSLVFLQGTWAQRLGGHQRGSGENDTRGKRRR